MEALLGIGTAFGLSTSAGLNAYIPMLMVAVLTRLNILSLQEPIRFQAAPFCSAHVASPTPFVAMI